MIIDFFSSFFLKVFSLDQGPFVEPLIAPVLDFVCPSSWVSNLSCLRGVILKVTTGVTPAFSTNKGVHCISMYTAWLAWLLSHALGFEPPTQR